MKLAGEHLYHIEILLRMNVKAFCLILQCPNISSGHYHAFYAPYNYGSRSHFAQNLEEVVLLLDTLNDKTF